MGPVRVKVACQKCRALKHKCDFKYPKCSRCERGKIECMVQDLSTRELRPRNTFEPKTNTPPQSSNEQIGANKNTIILDPTSGSNSSPQNQSSLVGSADRNGVYNQGGSFNQIQIMQTEASQLQGPSPLGGVPTTPSYMETSQIPPSGAPPMMNPYYGRNPPPVPFTPHPPFGMPGSEMHPPYGGPGPGYVPPGLHGYPVPYPPQMIPSHAPFNNPGNNNDNNNLIENSNGNANIKVGMHPGATVVGDIYSIDKPSKFGLTMSQITALSFIPFKSSFVHLNGKSNVNDISMFGENGSSSRSTPSPEEELNYSMDHLVRLPNKSLAQEIILENYFKHAWIQFPIISYNKSEISFIIDQIYDVIDNINIDAKYKEHEVVSLLVSGLEAEVNPLDIFTIYILLAIGLGITADSTMGDVIKQGLSIESPKKYFTTATYFLDKYFKSISGLVRLPSNNNMSSFGLQFKSLQCLLLISVFGLLEPISPGIWYIISVAMRLAVDMDLHQESVLLQLEFEASRRPVSSLNKLPKKMIDYDFLTCHNSFSKSVYRQVFWSCYALERQVSFYVNKPFNISDFDITSTIDDYLVHENNALLFPGFYIRGRKLQSIIQQIMVIPASNHKESTHPLLLLSGSLMSFTNRTHADLNKWILDFIKLELSSNKAVVDTFHQIKDFVLLNYFQLIQHLYKPSSQRPKPLQDDLEVLSLASCQIILLYAKLKKLRRINFKYLSVHFIHQSSMGFLYSLVNSKMLSLDSNTPELITLFIEKSFTLIDYLKEGCPPAANVGTTLKHMYNATKELITKRQTESKARFRYSPLIAELLQGFKNLNEEERSPITGAETDGDHLEYHNYGVSIDSTEHALFLKYKCIPLKTKKPSKRSTEMKHSQDDSSSSLMSATSKPPAGIGSVELTPSSSQTSINLASNDLDIDEFLKSIMHGDLGFDINATKQMGISNSNTAPTSAFPSPMLLPEQRFKTSTASGTATSIPKIHSHLIEPSYQSGLSPRNMSPLPALSPNLHSVSSLANTPSSFNKSYRSTQKSPAEVKSENNVGATSSPDAIAAGIELNESGADGEFTDIQHIWEMLFDQPFNIKETMMNGGFSRSF